MVYAVDGVAFPVQPDAYMSMSSDQVVTGAQRTVGPGAQMTKELLAEKLTANCKWTFLTRDQFCVSNGCALGRTLSACGITMKIRIQSEKGNSTAVQ